MFVLQLFPLAYGQHCDVGALRTTINRLKQERCITPKLAFIRGGKDDASQFENYLIEEHDVDGTAFSSGTGFVSFLEEISRDVAEYLKQEQKIELW